MSIRVSAGSTDSVGLPSVRSDLISDGRPAHVAGRPPAKAT
uniref:Uncharacterized protein n=1 Tax=Setaria italica TaxID=4555 RepID=K3XTV7_SETIT